MVHHSSFPSEAQHWLHRFNVMVLKKLEILSFTPDTQFVPRNWDKVVLLYADLSDWKDQLGHAKAELPPRIQQDDETVTFTLYVINEMRQEHSGFNVTILEGETLLDGLHRAWKNRSNYFK